MTELSDIFKQARVMQEQMQKMQKELQIREVTGESGAGLVRVTMNGRHEVKQVQIDRALLAEEPAILEDLVTAAVNDAVRRVEENSRAALSGMASGLNLPPGLNFGA